MAIENHNDKFSEEEEGEVDLEAELVRALTELRKVRKECKHFNEEIKNIENEIQKSNKLIESTETMIIDLNIKTEEARVTKEAINNLLVEKDKENKGMKLEVVSLRNKVQ
jgi:chromosome segregation ATPase